MLPILPERGGKKEFMNTITRAGKVRQHQNGVADRSDSNEHEDKGILHG